MRLKLKESVVGAALTLVVFSIALIVTGTARRALTAPLPPPVLPSVEHSDDALHFTGALAGHAIARVRPHAATDGETLVVVLGARDVQTCEDLGRQLRELHRAFGTERRFLVMAEAAEASSVQAFLRYERLGRATFVDVSDGPLLADGSRPHTPTAMVVLPSGEVVRGVSHLTSAPNLRLHSFADHLELRGG